MPASTRSGMVIRQGTALHAGGEGLSASSGNEQSDCDSDKQDRSDSALALLFFVGHVTVAHFVATGAPPQGAGRSVVAQLQGGGAGGGDGGNKRPSKTSTPRRAQQSSTNTPPKVRAFVRPPFCQTAIDDFGIILSILVCKNDFSPQIARL